MYPELAAPGLQGQAVQEADERAPVGPLYPEVSSLVSGKEEAIDLVNWQRGKDVLACNRVMLENQVDCDVWFRVGVAPPRLGGTPPVPPGPQAPGPQPPTTAAAAAEERRGEQKGKEEGAAAAEEEAASGDGRQREEMVVEVVEEQQRVGAHAYVLRSRSTVFYRMLKKEEEKEEESDGGKARGGGGAAAGGGPSRIAAADILLPNTSPAVFWQFLRYLYYEDLQLEAGTVRDLLALAETYDVVALRDACLRFLHGCLAVGTACAILEAAHRCGDRPLGEAALRFFREHGHEVLGLRRPGSDDNDNGDDNDDPGNNRGGQEGAAVEEEVEVVVADLCRECLNQVLTLEELALTAAQRQQVADRWARLRCQSSSQEPTADNKQRSLGDCHYVRKDPAQSRCYFSADKTAKPGGGSRSRPQKAFSSSSSSFSSNNSAAKSKGSLTSSPRPAAFAAGSDLQQVTRFAEFRGTLNNTRTAADAVSFTVSRDILLYGFGIYGHSAGKGTEEEQGNEEKEATFKVDAALSRKKEDLVLETMVVKGAGVILPVMFQEPVRVKNGKVHTLEIYVQGPPSHRGVSGEATISLSVSLDHDHEHAARARACSVTFTFSQAPDSVKGNRTTVRAGQIPRLFYLPA
ncbi:BTB/POZ domain-containing protein 6-B-like [Babylonia areolata]|uniref:BTB/POZ domain-containing protein 6-B-like n=1 Tax=Babylonia areolata TaxID=304850 RepID=UPI003FD653D6